MSPITAQQAWDATNPEDSDDARQEAASRIMTGVAANDAYLNSRSELEQLKYLAQGPQVVAHADLSDPSQVESGDQTAEGGVIEGTATEESPLTAVGTGDTSGDTTAAVAAGSPGADNPEAAVAKLRAQLQNAGIQPEA